MVVEAISNQDFIDDFGVDIKVGESIMGEATRYSQNYIWIDIMLDTAVNPKTEEYFLNGIENKSVKILVLKNSIKRKKCNYCDNFDTGSGICESDDCEYLQFKSKEPEDYSLVQDYSCGGME